MFQFTAKDIIAIIILLAAFVLIYLGVDSWLQGIVALIVGYYFGRRTDYELKKKQ